MTGGELSADERGLIRARCACDNCRLGLPGDCRTVLSVARIVAARVATVEAERDKAEIRAAQEANDAHEWGIQNDALKAEVARLIAERDEALRLLAPKGHRFIDRRDEEQIPRCVDLLLSDDWDAEADGAWTADFRHLAGHANSLIIRANGIRGAALVEALAKTRAENRRLSALVEAGLALADEWHATGSLLATDGSRALALCAALTASSVDTREASVDTTEGGGAK